MWPQKKGDKTGEVDERSSKDQGVKGGALVGLSQPYLGCVLRKNKEHQMSSDLIFSHKIYNHKGAASEWKTALK